MKNARNLAHDSLYNIKIKKAYSNIEINKTLKESKLKTVDKGFYTELVYGSLENLIYLDHIIQKFSKISIEKLSTSVLIILEMGLYQIMKMDSVSDFAAVNESVALCNYIDKKSSGFVNAILRNILRDEKAYAIQNKTKEETLRIRHSISEYIFSRLIENYGYEDAKSILESFEQKPDIYIRVNLNKITKAELKTALEQMNIEVTDIPFSQVALKVKGLKSIETNEHYQKGHFTVQDLSSMICVEILDPQKEDKILDLCSCPGGKTTYIGEKMQNQGIIHAMDLTQAKLKLVSKSVNRLDINNVKYAVNDATNHKKTLENKYNKVLVDAPCSGYGIIRRKPEIRYKTKEEVMPLPLIQTQILANAANYVKEGGTLIYSTCTIEPKENQEIIEQFLQNNNNFQIQNISHPQIKSQNGQYGIQLLPNIDNCDGFFIAKLTKTKGD